MDGRMIVRLTVGLDMRKTELLAQSQDRLTGLGRIALVVVVGIDIIADFRHVVVDVPEADRSDHFMVCFDRPNIGYGLIEVQYPFDPRFGTPGIDVFDFSDRFVIAEINGP